MTTQHDLWLKAFGLLYNAQARKAARVPQKLEKIGAVHHLIRSSSTLTPEARAVWLARRATNAEEHAAIRGFLKPVSVYRVEYRARGKTYTETGRQEAARRLARMK